MRLFSVLFLVVMSFQALAQVDSQINFRGQNSEVIKVEKNIKVTRPVPYQVPDTCYNDVPYQSYECRNVTRYREECRYIPSSENCWTENDRVCRNVTRYREECSTGPSHQVCTNNPSRQVCTERPSRQVCTERPTREVCRTNSQGQQTCQTVGGGQSCQTVGGGQSCTTVGGGQSCHSVPGERTCRQVSYTDQDCDNVPRRRCETIPARNQCDQIPYSEEVCGNETRYRQEPYACERTQYRDETTVKKLIGQIDVRFETNGLVEEFPVKVTVAAANAKFETFATDVKLLKEPKVLVFLKKKNVVANETAKEINLSGEIVMEVVNAQMVSPVFPDAIKSPAFNDSTDIMTFVLEGGISAKGSVEAKIVAKPKVGKDKVLAELKAAYPSDRAGVAANKLSLNLAGLMQNDLVKKNSVSIKLMAPMNVRGELMNATRPVSEKSYTLEIRK